MAEFARGEAPDHAAAPLETLDCYALAPRLLSRGPSRKTGSCHSVGLTSYRSVSPDDGRTRHPSFTTSWSSRATRRL
jgi:hypothetical protein